MSFRIISVGYEAELSMRYGWGFKALDLGQPFTIYLEDRLCGRMWVTYDDVTPEEYE